MDIRQNPLLLGFSLGRWLGTDVRVSVWFPLVLIVFCFRLGMQLGLWVSLLLFISVLIHEFFHVFAARWTGGSGDEILMWPLGGLAFVSPASGFQSQFWTSAAGPMANALLCAATLPFVISSGVLRASVHPIYLPPIDFDSAIAWDIAILTFSLNFKLLLLNLLPVHPLDGGQMTFSIAQLYWDRDTARLGSLWLGLFVCIVLSAVGLMLDSIETIYVSFLLGALCMQEFMVARFTLQFRSETGGGYDFSQGDLEFDVDSDYEPRPNPLQLWKQRREERRREKEELKRRETERRVDELLDKVHTHGMASLSDAERRFLERASSKYRSEEG